MNTDIFLLKNYLIAAIFLNCTLLYGMSPRMIPSSFFCCLDNEEGEEEYFQSEQSSVNPRQLDSFHTTAPAFSSINYPDFKLNEIETIDAAASELAIADQNTLIAVDIDETILEPEDPPFQQRYYAATQTIIRSLPDDHKPLRTIIDSLDFFFKQPRHIIEPRTADLIKDLQKRAVPVIALSAFAGGQVLHFCDDIHEHRHLELVRNGIDFDQPLPVNSNKLNEDLYAFSQSNTALLKRGLLSCYPYNKGLILRLFIKHMIKPPDKVIFLDDVEQNLSDVYDYLKPLNIAVSTYLYRGAYTIKDSDHLDLAATRKQFELIVEKGSYVSYKDAEKSLATQVQSYEKESTLKPNYSYIIEPLPIAGSSYTRDK